MPDESERDELVMTLVESALQHPPEEREHFLLLKCGGNSDLFDEVSERVAWEERMGAFLREPLVPVREIVDRPFEPGELVGGRFRIVRQVGQGGMGVVYDANDEKLERRIAIKCGKLGFRNRVPPEVRAAREVSHFNVCKVYDLHTVKTANGEIDFLTMEFIEGETLAARIAREPLSERELREIVSQTAAGLAQAHRQGVIHGDLKPANIILTTGPDKRLRAVITDFGLAKLHESAGAHATSDRGGTYAYMAPELLTGARATVASDIYAFGVMIREILAPAASEGATTATRATTVTLAEVATDVVAAPPEVLPSSWSSVVEKATAADPKNRFASADALAASLVRKPSGWKWSIAAAVLVLLAVAIGVWQAGRVGPPMRLAILPFAIEGVPAPAAVGVAHDVATRLAGSRRALIVLTPEEARQWRVDSSEKALKVLGATHALRTQVRHDGSKLFVRAALLDATSGHAIRELEGSYAGSDPGALTKALLATVTRGLGLRLATQESVSSAAYASYVRGVELLRGGESIEKALPFFETAAQLDPKSALPLAGIAEIEWRNSRDIADRSWLDRAQATIAKARSLNPDCVPVLLIDGSIKAEQGWYEQAVQDFRRVIELEPDNPEGRRRLAVAYQSLRRPAEALATIQQAIDGQPNYFRHHLDLFVFHWKQADYRKAEAAVRKLTEVAPGMFAGYVNLGNVLMAQGRYSEAEAAAQQSLKLRETPMGYFLLANASYYQQRYSDAIPIMEKLIANWSPSALECLLLGRAYAFAGREREARETHSKGLKLAESAVLINPRDAFSRAQAALFLARLGEKSRAEYEIAQAMQTSPEDAQVRRLAAETYETVGQRDRVLSVLAGTPPAMLAEVSRSPNFADLQRDGRFIELLGKNPVP